MNTQHAYMGHPRLLTHSFREASTGLEPVLLAPSAERPRRFPLVLATLKRKPPTRTRTE